MGGEGVGERTDVSLSMVLLSPPRATLVSSVGQQALVATVSVVHPVSDLVVNVSLFCYFAFYGFLWVFLYLLYLFFVSVLEGNLI